MDTKPFIYTRSCSRCIETKKFSEFDQSRGKPVSICKECKKEKYRFSSKNQGIKTRDHPWMIQKRAMFKKFSHQNDGCIP